MKKLILKTTVATLVIGGSMMMYSSCKKERSVESVYQVNSNNPEARNNVDYSIIDTVSAKTSSLIYAIGLLDESAFCSFNSIINGSDILDEVVGTVPSDSTIVVTIPSLQPTSVLTLTNTGTMPLRFCGSDMPGIDCGIVGIILDSGQSITVALQDIAPASIVPVALNVSHTVAPPSSPVGNFSVVYSISKMEQLSSIPEFANVVAVMNDIDDFIFNNPDFAVYMTDQDNQEYLGHGVLGNLGYDVDMQNINCNAYNAGIKSCGAGFVACAVSAAFTGPAWGFFLGLCGVQLMYCVDAMDAAYPGCVPKGDNPIFTNLKELWSPKVTYNCID
ncbi:MAG: hypothetical protein J5I91_08960 [Bacteroidetes bacterium]|nr:hypothetical protein [Bacteroidota bacterium]